MIICFGSINNDLFFKVDRLKPVGEITMVSSHQVSVGGKGANQAVAAARAGSQVSFYGCVGPDDIGQSIIKDLQSKNIKTDGIVIADVPTGTAVELVNAAGDHQVVYSQSANARVKAEQVPNEVLNKNSLVLVQGDIPMRENEILLQRAKQAGARTLLNLGPPAFISPTALNYVDYLVLNEPESNALAKQLGVQSDDKNQLARFLSNTFKLTALITLGKNGAIACEPDGRSYSAGCLKIDPVDMVGAGDAFIGFLAQAIEAGLPLNQSLARASAAGGLTCLKVGAQTAMPSSAEVDIRAQEVHVQINRARPVAL